MSGQRHVAEVSEEQAATAALAGCLLVLPHLLRICRAQLPQGANEAAHGLRSCAGDLAVPCRLADERQSGFGWRKACLGNGVLTGPPAASNSCKAACLDCSRRIMAALSKARWLHTCSSLQRGQDELEQSIAHRARAWCFWQPAAVCISRQWTLGLIALRCRLGKEHQLVPDAACTSLDDQAAQAEQLAAKTAALLQSLRQPAVQAAPTAPKVPRLSC